MVKCSKCGSDNPADRKFCGECGKKLGILCKKCKTVNDPGQKFCGECGAQLGKPDEKPAKGKPHPDEKTPVKEKAEKKEKLAAEAKPSAKGKGAETVQPGASTEKMLLIAIGVVAIAILVVFLMMLGGVFNPQAILTTGGAGCGDGLCSGNETCTNCPDDCGACTSFARPSASCGDGICSTQESCSSCPLDCGVCPPFGSVAAQPYCGDGMCGSSETRASCSTDCGTLLENGLNCLQNQDCKSGYCINKVCRESSSYTQEAEPTGYSVSWSPLTGEGFWTLFPEGPETSSAGAMYAPGGLYGWDVMYINGMPVPYDYWTAYAIEHCLENYMGLGPQEIRAAADDPTLNCERFNVTSAPAVPRQECNESYSWCAPKGKCIRIWEETCY